MLQQVYLTSKECFYSIFFLTYSFFLHLRLLVFFFFFDSDKNTVKSIIKALGFAKLELNVTKRTTHVVTTGVRTINLLHGIIRGCWLVRFEWILKSLENNAWLPPGKYEMTHFSKAVQVN